MQRYPSSGLRRGLLARRAVHSRQPPARDDLGLGDRIEVDDAKDVIGEAVEVRGDVGVAAARPPQPVDPEPGHLEERDLAHLRRLGDVVDREARTEFLALGDAVRQVVLEVAALAVVGLHRDDVRAIAEQHHVIGDLDAVCAGQIAKREVVDWFQIARISGVEDGEAVREHVADVDMAAMDHDLHGVRAAALVAVGNVADAPADALRRDVGFALRACRERQAPERCKSGKTAQMLASRTHGRPLLEARPFSH